MSCAIWRVCDFTVQVRRVRGSCIMKAPAVANWDSEGATNVRVI